MEIDRYSVRFYIGAATTGEGEGKWSAPARDLEYLYERRMVMGGGSSIEPDLETWKRFGVAVVMTKTQGEWQAILQRVDQLIEVVGEVEVHEMLLHSRGTYLKSSKDKVLDWLGCPS